MSNKWICVTPAAVAAAAVLVGAGCSSGSGGLPTPGVAMALPQAQRPQRQGGSTWAKSVFVSDHFASKVYQFADSDKSEVIGTIADSAGPGGLDMDAKGNLYVASEGDYGVNVYAPNTYTAMKTLSDPNEYIAAVAVCPDGRVYATNEFNTSRGPGNVVYYSPGSTKPNGSVSTANMLSAQFASCDKNNVLWLTYLDTSYQMQVASYDGHKVKGYGNESLGNADSASGIQALSNGYLAIGNASVGINRYNDPPGKGGPTRALGCRTGGAIAFAFDRADKDIFEVNSSTSIAKCDRNGEQLYTIGQGVLETAGYAYAYPAGND
jgi:hypothetical protein